MFVTKIEPVTKMKYKVYLEGQFAFVLYKSELSRYRIKEGYDLEQAEVEKIKKEVVLRRAKLRAMHLLNDMDRTEHQLRTKLRQGLYTEDIIEQAIQYVKSFGYIEDYNYTRRFILNSQNQKSKKEIYAALCQKGVEREVIESLMKECYEEQDEQEAIRRILLKKHFNVEGGTEEEKARIFRYLVRKGFQYEDIRQVIQVS